nr:putative retrotransposon Gag domain, aspartic peptidase domain protein [Tanacetum cinerariifolium]
MEDPFREKSVTSGIRARFEAMAIEIEKNAASGSTVIDENRGRDDLRQNPKKRGKSKNIVASLDQRVAGVETSMSYLKTQVKGLEGLTPTSRRFVHGRDHEDTGGVGVEVSTLHQTIKDLQVDVALCKRSLASGGGNTNHGPKIDVPKPSPFVEKRRYGDIDQGTTTINTWAEFVVDFKKQFYSENGKNEGKKNAQPKVDAARKPPTRKDKNLKTSYKSGGCFICDGPHRARDFPKKASLNGLSTHKDEEASDGRSMGSIRILNAIKEKT